MRQIAAKCPKKFNSRTSFSRTTQSKKRLCYTPKVTQHRNLKTKVGQVLASCLVTSHPQNFPVTPVIIDSGATDYFFCNRDLFTTYTKYQHKFQTGSGEKIATHDYGNVDVRLSDHEGNISILTVNNVSWAPELGHNLLSIIPLARKDIEVFLRKAGHPSDIVVDEEVFGVASSS